MSGDHARRDSWVPNALHDQAVPNILPEEDDGDASEDLWEPPAAATPDGAEELEQVAARLYALVQQFVTSSEAIEAQLLEGFQAEAAHLARQCGDLVIRDADDERISFRSDGSFAGEVVLEDAPTSWRPLETARDIVNVFDPSDLFSDLAARLATLEPSIGSPDATNAGPRLRQLAEAFAEREASHRDPAEAAEVGLIERFEEAAAPFTRKIGDIIFLDGADERVTLERDGLIVAQVVPEDDENTWRTLRTPDRVTDYYKPEELFRALAAELGKAYPAADEGAGVTAYELHLLAQVWREKCLDAEATQFAAFNRASAQLASTLGEFAIVNDDDERLVLDADGQIRARVLDRSTGVWRELDAPDELVESYDPTDVFADLADALADAFPAIAVTRQASAES